MVYFHIGLHSRLTSFRTLVITVKYKLSTRIRYFDRWCRKNDIWKVSFAWQVSILQLFCINIVSWVITIVKWYRNYRVNPIYFNLLYPYVKCTQPEQINETNKCVLLFQKYIGGCIYKYTGWHFLAMHQQALLLTSLLLELVINTHAWAIPSSDNLLYSNDWEEWIRYSHFSVIGFSERRMLTVDQ